MSVFLVCFICFAVVVWWVAESSYGISRVKSDGKVVSNKKSMKWGFGSLLLK
uniref:ATP synthase F0 subunit 8 n=1 Tax=Cuneopsis heudei TaxID=232579 RepID=A0A2I7ML93_9BIVA|nr:ATP synthase F0 subunit 8 [Cuneopsis heudei]